MIAAIMDAFTTLSRADRQAVRGLSGWFGGGMKKVRHRGRKVGVEDKCGFKREDFRDVILEIGWPVIQCRNRRGYALLDKTSCVPKSAFQ
jgi:hypothetical protein